MKLLLVPAALHHDYRSGLSLAEINSENIYKHTVPSMNAIGVRHAKRIVKDLIST